MVAQNDFNRGTDGDYQLDLERSTIRRGPYEIEYPCDTLEISVHCSGGNYPPCKNRGIEIRVLFFVRHKGIPCPKQEVSDLLSPCLRDINIEVTFRVERAIEELESRGARNNSAGVGLQVTEGQWVGEVLRQDPVYIISSFDVDGYECVDRVIGSEEKDKAFGCTITQHQGANSFVHQHGFEE